ncbi:MAG: glycoside hydrolase family 9 protein, partial [Candidatus Thermoplasmatota archaeon]|nr:glycoside hydrolase family 9 protein [Candidatus Thermoplasmatota archaeon]MBU1940247.1 glycoside hydrolase family 9 protein [Candidatus Thermoplasmatota archaeon]
KTRMHPQKDDKILTDWNALMIVALSKASQIFTTKKYLIAAEKALQFINTTMLQKDGSLLHRYRHGEAKIDGYADDYAFLIWALLELYQATFKPVYLQQSLKLTSYLMNHFWDTTHGGLYFTSDTHEQLITRTKELYDGAIPSANSITLHNLIQLARITGNSAFENKAHQIITAFSDQITTTPQGYTQFMLGLEYMFGSAYELVIVGKHADKNTQTILQTIQSFYLPNKVLILKDPTIREEIENLAPFTQPFIQIQNKPTLYVCKNHHCELPTTKIQQIQYLLN